MPRTAMHSRRSRPSCSLMALATVLAVGATPAAAQSFLGTGTYATNPNATGITTGVGTTTINLNPGQTVINWVPTDNATNTNANIVFQNAGTTATFTSGGDFSVLNNINSASVSRAIQMNGTVNARVGGVQRGNVYFYAPGGFVLGGSSVFSVGSLVVSASPVQWSANGFISNVGTDNTVVFGQALNPEAGIVSSGSINANFVPFGVGSGTSSYVAMVAPRVQHSGTITVNGSAALVGAEAATINFSPDGLFDIQVTVGSDHSLADGVNVTGDILGEAPSGVSDQHRVYLVAVPKNDAMTMVIGQGADLGFTLANNASIDQYGAVVLSAGHDITNGNVGAESAGSNAPANFTLTGAHVTNNLVGEATGTAGLYANAGQTTVFDSNVTVHADVSAEIRSSGTGALLQVAGDADLSTDRLSPVDGGSATGGTTSITAENNGSITIAGNLEMTADGEGGSSGESVAAGNGTGGTVNVSATSGGAIVLGTANGGGNVDLSASGTGGTGFDGSSGKGTGGTVSIQLSGSGDVTIFGDTEVLAEGRGGTNWDSAVTAGIGEGGTINVGVTGTGSTLLLPGALMSANGEGGGAGEGTCCAAVGGTGLGGLVSVAVSGGGLIQTPGTLELSAAGEGGWASGIGGNGIGGRNGDGVIVDVQAGGTLSAGNLWLDASGSGGDGDGDGGNGTGGFALLHISGGTANITGELNVDADGFGGDSNFGGNGGIGTGGIAEILASNSTAVLNAVDVLIEADGTGGESNNFSEGPLGDGGDGLGGQVRAIAEAGLIHITGDLEMDATATGGAGANGGDAVGIVTPSNNEGLPPAAMLWAGQSTATLQVDGVTDIDVSATGGTGFDGNGGSASGGEIDIVSRHGDIDLGSLIGNAEGLGGDGGFGGGIGGNGTGGGIDVAWSIDQSTGLTGSISIDSAALSANGFGGDGGDGFFDGGAGGAGGNGTGGSVSYVGSAGGGTFDVGSTIITANGIGGNGGHGGGAEVGFGGNGGAGGTGAGGFIQTGTLSNDGSTTSGGTAAFTSLSASANASGGVGGDGGFGGAGTGAGGNGGNAIAGRSTFLVRGIEVTANEVNLFANATGGNGGAGSIDGNGGNATGGLIRIESKDRFGHADERGNLIAGTINGTAIAQGGIGATNGSSTVVGGSYFSILNGDADIGTVNMLIAGNGFDATLGPNYIQVQDGDATVDNFSFVTDGQLAVYSAAIDTDPGTTNTLRTIDMVLSADNFVDYPAAPEPANPGTLFATNLSVTSGGDFIADANLDVVNGIDITVPGSIRFDNARTDSSVDLHAQGGSIAIGNVNSASSTSLVAQSFIQGGNILAGGSIFAQALGGNIDLGGLTSTFGSIFVDAAGDVDLAGNALADGGIELDATGAIVMQNATAGESVDLSAGGGVTALNLTGGDSVLVQAGGSVNVGDVSAGLVNPSTNEGADYEVRIVADGNILAGDISAAGHVGLAAPGTITAADIVAGGVFMALGHGDMSFGNATADEVFLSDFAILNPGGLTATCIGACGTAGANGVVTAPPTGPSYAYVTTAGGTPGAGQLSVGGTNGSVYTTSEFEVAAGEALDFFFNYVTSDGSGFADYAWAGLFTPSLDPVAILYTARTQPEGTIVPGFGLPGVEATLDPASVPIIPGGPQWSALGGDSGACFAAGCGYTGWVSSSYDIPQAGTYVLRFGVSNFVDTGFQSGMAFSGLTVGGVSLTPTLLTRTGGSITIGNINTNKFSAAAGTSLTTGIIDSSGAITLNAGAAITTGNLFAGNFVLANGGSITTQNIEAGSVDMTSTNGNIATGDILAFGSVDLNATFGNIQTGDITAESIDLLAGNDIGTGDLSTELPLLLAQDGPVTTFLFPGASITLDAGGDILTGDISSIDGVHADAGASLSTGAIDAVDFVQLLAGGNVSTGAINAGSFIDILSSSGAITTQALTADGDIDLEAGGNIAFTSANAGGQFDFSAGGSVTGGSVVAGNNIGGDAAGSVTLGNLTAGLPVGDDFSIGIAAIGNITVGNATGAGHVGFATQGNLATGNLNSADLVMTLVGGNTTTGSITTGGEGGGQVYMADDSMFLTGGGTLDGEGDFDPSIVLALEPVATGGSITINGPVSTGLFQAAAGTTLTTQALSAGDAIAFAGGLATINGAWNVGDAKVISNDIDIGAGGSITADGDITLVSKNATRTVVGDGVNLAGYNVSSGEFGKLSANDVTIIADTAEGAAATMVIGNLTANAAAFPGGIDYSFLTGNSQTETASGSIRVNGNVVFNGMTTAGHSANFGTALFELDAATGSISLFSSGTTLGGELGLYANRIHVAEASILNQLAANPTYTGYQQDLNEAAAVQRPEGVLRADTLWIESDNLQSLLIQNTGTFDTRAGFVVREAFINDDSAVAGPPGSINMVVNGQVIGESGTLTGVAARDALVPEGTDITPFTANSTINGCPLTGACIIAPPPPPPTANVVDNFIDLINGNPLGDSDFGNEEDIDDNSEGDEGANNPISPPQPLFDTRPLIPSGDVNDPVSGTGNPALLGSDGQCEAEEGGQCPANPANGDGQ